MTIRNDQDLIAQAGFMTTQSIAQQLGEAICAKTQAEAQAGVFHDEIMQLRGALEEAGAEIRRLTDIIAPPSEAPQSEPHAVDHPDDDPGVPGSAAMLHPEGAPANHPPEPVAPGRRRRTAARTPGADAVLEHAG